MTPQTNWLPAAELAVQSASIEHIMAIALEFVRLPVNDRPLYSFCSRTLLRELLDDCKKITLNMDIWSVIKCDYEAFNAVAKKKRPIDSLCYSVLFFLASGSPRHGLPTIAEFAEEAFRDAFPKPDAGRLILEIIQKHTSQNREY